MGAGTPPAFAVVGVCEDGIQLEFQVFAKEIKSDGAGGPEGAPANFYFLNAVLIARCNLVPYGGTYVNRLRAMAAANQGGTEGVMVMPGTIYEDGNNLPGVRFSSSDVDGGWWLRDCLVSRAGNFKAGVIESKPEWEFKAINCYNPATTATISGNVLYSKI